MKQKRTIYSLLLTSFILVFAFSSLSAQTVSFGSLNVLRCQENTVDITVDAGADISAFEVVFDVVSTSGGAGFSAVDVNWDPGLTVLTSRIIDLSGFDTITGTGTIRIAGMLIDNGDACLTAGATVVGQVIFTTNNVCSGTIDLVGGTFACGGSSPVTATTQFVDCGDNSLIAASVTAGTISISNTIPTIASVPDATIEWGETYVGIATGSDADEATCETLDYGIVSGPVDMTINSSGVITWPTDGADVCTHVVEVEVIDACGASASTTFEICVHNFAPTLAADGEVEPIVWSNTASGTVTGIDPDGGPTALLYTVDNFTGPGSVNIDPATGAWDWDTMEDNGYLGCHTLTIKVTDGANVCDPCSPSNSATVDVEICVIPTIRVTIEKTHMTIQGQYEEVGIFLDNTIDPANEMGGFNFLIQYDASALAFASATAGAMLDECGWEYFTYRYGVNGNCGPGACPSGVLRLVAIAEYNNGENHPTCFLGTSDELATLSFFVTDDRTLECQYVPIRFVWYECGDNAISSQSGDTLFISRYVYDYMDFTGEITGTADYPTFQGAQDIDCFVGDPDKIPLRLVDYFNGGIDIACADSIDARGDINLNEIGYEIADAVLFSRYFVYGLSVFEVNVDGQIAASDVNADGITLSVADLVYLIRVVVGDAMPYPKELAPVAATYSHARTGVLSVNNASVGGAYVVIEGNSTPELLAENMEMMYNFDGVNTRILVYSLQNNSFSGNFLNANGNVVSIEMATYEGNPIAAKEIPTEFALRQNYPNPFNPKTIMAFDLPKASDVTLKIYNVKGQQVASFDSFHEAGTVTIEWDASNLASGIYFYKLNAGNFSDTKKMVLLK
ncbi:MAG: T9SS type A sorting domain-containing protein [candidate division Zixibacteria bacterium]|nr:T9SS type A sorting domain-containing protein [candidate division Zixibacteria bacterium]